MKNPFLLLCYFISTQVGSTSNPIEYKFQGSVNKYIEFNLIGVDSALCKQGAAGYTRLRGLPKGVYRKGCTVYGKPKYTGTSNLSFLSEESEWTAELVITGEKKNPELSKKKKQSTTSVSQIISKDINTKKFNISPISNVAPNNLTQRAKTINKKHKYFKEKYTLASVRKIIPDAPTLDGIYPPMSANKGPRWNFIKMQYNLWYHKQAPSNNNGVRGTGNGEAWRFDPMKTLVELCRRAKLVDDKIPGVCADAKATIAEFFSRQYWGSKGNYPDCSGGLTGIAKGKKFADKCDFKYGGHASAFYYASKLYSQKPYTTQQKTMLKDYCYQMGWNAQVFTERHWGISLQCLIDLQKQGFDTSTERKDLITRLYAKFNASGTVGAPLHGMNSHEGTLFSPDPLMFSPWMSASFLIPALWEHWVFLEKDPRIAKMIVMYGNAMMQYAIVNPKVWAPKEPWGWKHKKNPTKWLTLYYAIPSNKLLNIKLQGADGGYSDSHNPETIFALNAAYFFSCSEAIKKRSEAMTPFFNQRMAADDPKEISRLFLWQHRGSASTEWLLENANCPPPT